MQLPDTLERRSVADLKQAQRNARTHSKAQIKQIADSIERFGFTNPVLVDAQGRLIAGHGRVEAAKQLGLETVPTLCLDHLSEEQVRAYVIADNKLAENAGWDDELLALEFQYLDSLDLDFDLTITGFEMAEIDAMLVLDPEAEEEAIPEPCDEPSVTQPGDLWLIGKHRLYCGDATKSEAYEALFDGSKPAQMAFTDPPYNVPISGHVCGLGAVQHREFEMAAGEMTKEQFEAFLKSVFTYLAANSVDGSIHYICMDWRHMAEVLTAGETAYDELKNLCVWAKTNGGMGSLYRSQHELVFVFKHGTKPHINNVKLGKHGRYRTNVWEYAGINSFGQSRDEDLATHPTVKPVKLVEDAILDCSKRGGIILDAFAGSGTSLIAAHRTGRVGYGLELDPAYCDVIIKRLQAETGLKAKLAGSDERIDTRAPSLPEREMADV
ncbi:DNA methyltransferase [uncultured Erythrobacter sp.]|uniref:site-specific DNA-methyltransferase n=1 Tax=uncultured Erythrobacter sp. TaxID=263913 RepID=UPI00262BF32A|nr:DNA methyltransferase [uncultured Erythrobacter sp.]